MTTSAFQETVFKTPTPFYKKLKFWLLLFIGIGLWMGFNYYRNVQAKAQNTPNFKTTAIERGNLNVTITATGTLKPVKEVSVGTEVSGTVAQVLVDYNDQVKAGQVLARLDTAKLQDQAAQSRASLRSAEAGLMEAQATVVEARANLERYRALYNLGTGKVLAKQELDAAEATYKRANAAEVTARAKIDEARAKLKLDETNLAKATIISPINGIVLSRGVEPGQTVAASLQAPVLFTLAEDLRQMMLYVNVDEADVGQVKENQSANFTISAYPDRIFQAKITQVRYESTTEDNVVSYEALLAVDNADLSLRPGMTATADIIVQSVENALLIPSSALRFTPAPVEEASKSFNVVSILLPRPPRPTRSVQQLQPQRTAGQTGKIWLLDAQKQAKPVNITLGITDGRKIQISAGEVAEKQLVITDYQK